MAVIVQDKNQISLDGVRYPIRGKVQPKMLSRFPQKFITGDYDFSNENYLSSWTISDQTGGSLIEEMNETTDSKRFYWSSCDASHKGHLLLPPLATAASMPTVTMSELLDGGLETWASASNLTSWTETVTHFGSVAREAGTKTTGSYAAKLALSMGSDGTTSLSQISQAIANWDNDLRGAQVFFFADLYSTLESSDNYCIQISDGITTTSYQAPTADEYNTLQCTKTLAANATGLTVTAYCNNVDWAAETIYVDNIVAPIFTQASITKYCPFNTNLYYAGGGYLYKMNSSGTHSIVAVFPWAITDIAVSVTNTLLIAFGTKNYYSMTTAEVFTLKTNTTHTYKYWIKMSSVNMGAMDADGNFYYTTTPETIDWTGNGSVTGIATGSVTGILLAPDSSGSMVVNVVTNTGLWVHDYTNSLFYDTGVSYPDYSHYPSSSALTGGLGFCLFGSSIYVSSGLDIWKYTPTAGTVENVGLNRDDGIAAWDMVGTSYIQSMCTGRDGVYCGIYSTATSSVYGGIFKLKADDSIARYWTIQDTETVFSSTAISMSTSSVYSGRLWFYGGISTGNSLYYIAEQGSSINPKKISGYTYEDETTGGAVHITPWFDANAAGDLKTATKVELACNDTTADETIEISYRINHENSTSLTTGWTSLGTIAAAGSGKTTTHHFGLGYGVAFYAIQFKFTLVRGSTNTNSPDLTSFKFSYIPEVTPRWSYSVTIDCSKGGFGYSPQGMERALLTVCKNTAGTLKEFTIHDAVSSTEEIHYVKVQACEGITESGATFDGLYNITLLEPSEPGTPETIPAYDGGFASNTAWYGTIDNGDSTTAIFTTTIDGGGA